MNPLQKQEHWHPQVAALMGIPMGNGTKAYLLKALNLQSGYLVCDVYSG